MSVESMAITLNHSQASGTAKLVLIGIASHDGDGGAWPSIDTLARYANVTPRNVQKAIAHLGSLGEIAVYTQGGGSRSLPDHKRPNRYEITLKCPPNCDRTNKHKLVDNYNQALFKTPLSLATPPVGSDTPPPVGYDTPGGVASDTRTVIKKQPLELSLKVGHSPADNGLCWACGKQPAAARTQYCTGCASRGLNNPMISCHCGLRAARRKHRGQTHFFCHECPPKEALDGMKAQA